jgi:hypothetical protein
MKAYFSPQHNLGMSLSFAAILFSSLFYAADGSAVTSVSVDSFGISGNGESDQSSFSQNGRYITFRSAASNLVLEDQNEVADIFVRDRQTGSVTRVSVSSLGVEANHESDYPAISADGRFVTFSSKAGNLVENDTNGLYDVFVHDRESGLTERVSINSNKQGGNGNSFPSAISANGQIIAFASRAKNLVSFDRNGVFDIFAHDRSLGVTTRVSVDSQGVEANDFSASPVVSADGRWVAFSSKAENLVAGDTNHTLDIFVHDRVTGITTRESVNSAQVGGNGQSDFPAICADGRFVTFSSKASNLVTGDTNDTFDVFVRDRETQATTRVSVSSIGAEGNQNGDSIASSISADGRHIAFTSGASNLSPNDANGTFDAFIHDREMKVTARVSVGSVGESGNGSSYISAISADGRYIAFRSKASNLLAEDTNGRSDIFVQDLWVWNGFSDDPY